MVLKLHTGIISHNFLAKNFVKVTRYVLVISKVCNTDFCYMSPSLSSLLLEKASSSSTLRSGRGRPRLLLLHSAWCHWAASEAVTIIAKKMPPWWEVNGWRLDITNLFFPEKRYFPKIEFTRKLDLFCFDWKCKQKLWSGILLGDGVTCANVFVEQKNV